MSDVYGFRSWQQPISWYHQDKTKSNHACLYCGESLVHPSETPSDKEHLIARKFGPPSTSEGRGFNFIFRCCRECNAEKADAERHVSAVTLWTNPARRSDESINSRAVHKASREYHPEGGLVQDARTEHSVSLSIGGVLNFKFNYTGPPRLDDAAVHLLASRQVQALFSLVTSDDPRERGGLTLLPRKWIYRFGRYFLHTDWGNPQVVEITKRTLHWESQVLISTANGALKAILKCSPDERSGWFWALEWNRSTRVLGAICDPDSLPAWLRDLPELDWRLLPEGRSRREVPIAPAEDLLFHGNSQTINDELSNPGGV